MDKLTPENPAEWLAYKTLTYTWPLYAIGALYIAGPVIAWSLGTLAVVALYLGPAMRVDLKPHPIPPVVWAWILGMGAMLPILWLGHINWNFSAAQTIKSTIGWAKGWALMALFPLAGAVLPIRRSILIRGQCIVGLWVLCLAPLMLAAPYIGLPERIFTSPLKVVGGPGPEYFTVFLFTYDPATWSPRWQFFAPWSAFAALVGVMMVLFALEEENRNWRAIGLAAGTLMVLASKSRMGLVGLVLCTMPPRALGLMSKRWAWFTAAGLTASLAMTADRLIQTLTTGIATFKNARADSTRVRATLQRIAEERWRTEAPWFGHGTVQPGPHLVEYMPIGSHHTWYGLLFVKGLVGFMALLVPLLWQIGLALMDASRGPRGCLPLGIVMTIVLLSFGENLEIEAYMLWPGLLVLGLHARELANEKSPDFADRTDSAGAVPAE